MSHLFPHPLPWFVAGPLIGLVVPALLLLGNKPFGVSSNFRHLCAAVAPCGIEFFRHDWKRLGGWNLAFLSGIFAGAVTASQVAPPLSVTAVTTYDRCAASARAARSVRRCRTNCSHGPRSSRSKDSPRWSSAGFSSGSGQRMRAAALRATPLPVWPIGNRHPCWRCAASSRAVWREPT